MAACSHLDTVEFVAQRLTDHSQKLPKAIAQANDRAWQAVAVAWSGGWLLERMLELGG